MEGLAGLKHDVVGDVDDIVDGANTARFQAKPHPDRRRTHLHFIDHSGRVTRTKTGISDRDGHAIGNAGVLGTVSRGSRFHSPAGQR